MNREQMDKATELITELRRFAELLDYRKTEEAQELIDKLGDLLFENAPDNTKGEGA